MRRHDLRRHDHTPLTSTLLQTIFLTLSGSADPSPHSSNYRLAGRRFAVDRPVNQLESLDMTAGTEITRKPGIRPGRASEGGDLVHDGEGWVGNSTRRIQSWFDGTSHEIRIGGIGAFSVSVDGTEVVVLERVGGCDDDAFVNAVLGPVLILVLAIGDVFCIHASAILVGDCSVLFVGDSGQGKSTLAEALTDAGAGIWRLTDDVSPLRCVESGVELLSDFPQLKLSAAQQSSGSGEDSFSNVGVIYDLNRTSPEQSGTGVFQGGSSVLPRHSSDWRATVWPAAFSRKTCSAPTPARPRNWWISSLSMN